MRFIWRRRALILILIVIVLGVSGFQMLREKTIVKPVVEEKVIITPVKKVIGTSFEGRNIENYSYGNGGTHLVFVGGIHGGYEWNSVYLAYTFMDYLKIHPEIIPKNITIDIIPTANPDGIYKVTGKEGRFTVADVSTDKTILASGRFNGDNVDLNRNFDCGWKATSTWQTRTVSGGASAFSEPEAKVIRDFMTTLHPSFVVFWHSQSNAVYASQCKNGILSDTKNVMNLYSQASGYKANETFDAYATSGTADDWLASINIPAITVELKTHDNIDWDKNLAGIKALIKYYGKYLAV